MLAGEGATLLVTVDCGTTSDEPFAEARRLGLDIVVLDHHQAPERLPAVEALVNPNRQDDLSGLGHLCAAGVVFLALVATSRELRRQGVWAQRGGEPDLLAALDLVGLATVADVVPLRGLNRAFVRQGIAMMRARTRPGLAALMDVAGLDGRSSPGISASCSARASMPAGASGMPRWGPGYSSPPTRWRPRRSRPSSTG